ncbi:peroxisome proliferator-activated receptor gamma coactivator-related protein 1 [Rhinophrynus dorsalis]
MAARWGAGEETLTIGGMELFTAGGPLQCHALEEHESCSGLSDLALSSLDAGGFLGTFQGYIDHSIISIIDDAGAQSENKGHFDEENELSLLTALTEILDNADDENMSPFDSIPDTELLVSPKDRDNSSLQRFLSLSRTPSERETTCVDDQCGKVDARSAAQNWEFFPESISSTPKRYNRHRSARGRFSRTARKEPIQRSDGEEEEVHSPEKKFEPSNSLVAFEPDFSIDSAIKENTFEQEVFLKKSTPCIINTENVALNDLVKYMHPYCLPPIAVCLEPKDSEMEEILNEGVFLEIVSDGECIKLPVLIEPVDNNFESEFLAESFTTHSSEEMDSGVELQPPSVSEFSGELYGPVDCANGDQPLDKEKQLLASSLDHDYVDKSSLSSSEMDVGKEVLESLNQKEFIVEPSLENKNSIPETSVNIKLNNESILENEGQNLEQKEPVSLKTDQESESHSQVQGTQKGKKTNKEKRFKSKLKNKNKANDDKCQDEVEKMTQVIQPSSRRSSNPLLQESDFLIKQLDQVKRDSPMELRSSKIARPKGRSRENVHSNTVEKKLLNEKSKKAEKMFPVEKESSTFASENVDTNNGLAKNNEIIKDDLCDQIESTASEHVDNETVLSGKIVQPQDTTSQSPISTAADIQINQSPDIEEGILLQKEVDKEVAAAQLVKEAKPKSLSLSEYRMRLQQRKPITEEKESENMSASKWPSIPEPPTELAEIPCLIVPKKDSASSKPSKTTESLEVKACTSKPEEPLCTLASPASDCVSSVTALPPVELTEALQPKQPDVQCHPVAMDIAPFAVASQTNIPPPFYTPAWSSVPLQPPYYPSLPPLPAVPPFTNNIPHDSLHTVPMQPPPMMTWPPFPPPPFAMGPVHPPDLPVWVAGLPPPPPFWPHPPMQQGLHEGGGIPLQSSAGNLGSTAPPGLFSATNTNVLTDRTIPQEPYTAPIECSSQKILPHNHQIIREPLQKTDNSVLGPMDKNLCDPIKIAKETVKQTKSPLKHPESNTTKLTSNGCSDVIKSDLPQPVKSLEKPVTKMLADPRKANVPVKDAQSANQVVFKIMEILKKAQKHGFQIKPQPALDKGETNLAPESQKSLQSLEPASIQKTELTCENRPEVDKPMAVKNESAATVHEKPQTPTEIPSLHSEMLKQVADKPATQTSKMVANLNPQVPVLSAPSPEVCSVGESIQFTVSQPDDLKDPLGNFTCEEGIEASDLTSLLEQFEMSEAKDEELLAQKPDLNLAVGNSRSDTPVEKKIDKLLSPELVNTAGLTPPATPPHQLWKPVTAGSQTGKSKLLNTKLPNKTGASPVKTAKLIEAKPLPQSKLRNKSCMPPVSTGPPPVHVASGDHDYCILSASQSEKCSVPMPPKAETAIPPQPVLCEEGSRWNVKHHQNITIKPIVPFNKRVQSNVCQKMPSSIEPSDSTNKSICCNVAKLLPASSNIQEDPLDHRTNDIVDAVVKKHPDSVLMSPDASPSRNEGPEMRTNVITENTSVSRRSLRCYRKYKSSPSPKPPHWRGRQSSSNRSCSSHSSSSSSSRSRSPPSKRRRKSRSRNYHRSRSSSRSSCSSSSRSRSSSSYSSRSCSPSSSQSRSRSRSPYRRRYRSRTRRCESRESYQKQKMAHKERAIEERRVVYIGKINSQMTRSELRRRFSVFGEIEECTIHFRDQGDNYGFVTYRYTGEAFAAIENGHKLRLPDELPFDLCFGGRRQFCKSNYADLDSNRDDFDPAPSKSKFEALDFDTLLKQAQKSHRR